jgi:hypothetical protein
MHSANWVISPSCPLRSAGMLDVCPTALGQITTERGGALRGERETEDQT